MGIFGVEVWMHGYKYQNVEHDLSKVIFNQIVY